MNKQDIITALQAARKELLAQGLGGDETAKLLRCVKSLKCDVEREREADTKHAELMRVGKSAYSSIADMVAALNCDYDRLQELRRDSKDFENTHGYMSANAAQQELESAAGDCSSRDEAQQRIWEDALSIEVRSDWYSPGGDGDTGTPTEFRILLSTGGPASRIVGELNQYGEPSSAKLEVQDWFMPWTEYNGDEVSESVLLDYCRCFYFGEG